MRKSVFWLFIVVWVSACSPFDLPDTEIPEEAEASKALNAIEVPDNFDYATTREVVLNVSAIDNENTPLTGIPVSIYIAGEEPTFLESGIIGADQVLNTTLSLPASADSLLIYTPYPGLPNWHSVGLKAPEISYTIGVDNVSSSSGEGSNEFRSNGSSSTLPAVNTSGADPNAVVGLRSELVLIGEFNQQGVPFYLEPADDPVQQDMLDLIANSLPENQPVPTFNPEYIAENVSASTTFVEEGDLWITFVHEGAGYRNVLGYYVYDTNNPPAVPEDITELRVIFPNVSFTGSGGGLNTGNKVYLGRFPAGKTVGWFLIPDGWNAGNATPTIRGDIKYSDKNLNNYTQPAYRSHVVLLKDINRELLLLGFEDITRPGGDNDFNDAIFYVTANPFSAIQTAGLAETTSDGNDRDGDGVSDNNDAFPDDPNLSFIAYSPGENQYGTLAFEDLWPYRGDYDMNDIVIDYNIQEFRNTANKVLRLRCEFVLRAMGAGLRNGFAFELPVASAAIASVTGNILTEDYVQVASNGVEAGQDNAVIFVFDNGHQVLRAPTGGGLVNTEPQEAFVEPVTLVVDLELNEPVSSNVLGSAPYNPFIVKGMVRGQEIHLPDYPPTQKADFAIFGSANDDSDPGAGRYYRTVNNLPWGINVVQTFDYPTEKSPINSAYLRFVDWARSSGRDYRDWYGSKNGYRNTSKIY